MNETEDGTCTAADAAGVALALGLAVTAVVNLTGNLLTMAAFATDRSLRQKPANLLLLSLCCGDLLVGVSIPIRLGESVCGKWLYGMTMCQIHTFFIDIGIVVGFLSMSSIALDRYLLISRDYPRYVALQCRRRVLRGVAAVWSVALVVAVLEIVVWNAMDWPGADDLLDRRCYSPPRNNPIFAFTVFFVTFLVPILLIVGLSLRFLVLLRRRLARAPSAVEATRRKRAAGDTGGGDGSHQATSSSSRQENEDHRETAITDVGGSKASVSQDSPTGAETDSSTGGARGGAARASPATARRDKLRRRYVRPAVIMGSLVTAFLLCTLPYMLYISLVIRLCPACDMELVRFHLVNVLFLNSSINPFLYAATHPKIRASHVRLFRRVLAIPGRLCRKKAS